MITGYTMVGVVCDGCRAKGPGEERAGAPSYTDTQAKGFRTDAKAQGWANVGGADLCPDCAKTMRELMAP